MGADTCRSISVTAAAAGETLFLPRHGQPLIGLLYLRRGRVELPDNGGGPIPVQEKEAALFPAWREQRLNVREDASLILCAFQGEGAEELLARWNDRGGPVTSCRTLPGAEQLLPRLDAGSPGLARGQLQQAAAHLLELMLSQENPTEPHIPSYLQAMRRIMDTRYQEDLSLDALSARVGRSKFHLSRTFREFYHATPGEYLAEVRLTRAAQLLAASDLPVQEIGRQVGLSNSAYFTALFKRQYGRPPREYRMWARLNPAK